MNYPMMEHGYYWHPLLSLLWVIVAVVVILAVVRHNRRRCRHHGEGALETLRERYARGEISTAEFEERKKALIAQ